MLHQPHSNEREILLADALGGFLLELREIDIEHLVSFITLEYNDHIADLIASAAEPYLVPGFIKLGDGAMVEMDWGTLPKITVNLIVEAGSATINFAAILDAESVALRIDYIEFATGYEDPQDNTQYLHQALNSISLRTRSKLNANA